MSVKTLLMSNKKKNNGCWGIVETYGNISYDVSIQRNGETIYSLPTSTDGYYSYDVVLEVGDVIVPYSSNLSLNVIRNIEFEQETEHVYDPMIDRYVDVISKLTVTSIENDFYFQTGCYLYGMGGGSN